MRCAILRLMCISACAVMLCGCELVEKAYTPTVEFIKAHPELPAAASAATGGNSVVYWVIGLISAGLVAVHELRKNLRRDLNGKG